MDKDEKKSESALREERVLEFWRKNKIFEKSLEKKSPKGEFIFYEGPPTANGKPGIHHLEARAFKDAIPRYKTMRGFHVRRKGGWDTHGLPVELQVEKELNLDSKIAIEKYGIAKFNQQCKESVWKYVDLWGKFTERIGYWVDQKNPYVTYHNSYIESVWNILKKVNDQKLLYKDYKVVPWCPRCGTVLSSHELAQGYEDIKDLSVYVKFRVIDGNNTFAGSLSPSTDGALPLGSSACETPRQKHIATNSFILAWTTTPWTLPGNVALAVGKNIDYVKIEKPASTQGGGNEFLILAKKRLSVIDGDYKVIEELKGKDLIGLEYEPLYPFLENTISENERSKLKKAFKVYGADFVTTADGTGIVHTAVMYGQDDFILGTKIGLPKHHLVGLDGKFLAGTGFLEDRFVRDEDVAVDIMKDLAQKGLLLKKEKYGHSYPHCWRCKTALIYYARDSWYIRMSDKKIKKQLIDENEKINWEPGHICNGRFGEWLKDIKDWAISRERYWGTPLPVWICKTCKKISVIGSIKELKEKTKKSGNKYFVMRHGEANNNIEKIFYMNSQHNAVLTGLGKEQVLKSINNFDKKIDIIISSPFSRAQQTAEIISEQIGFPLEKIIYDKRIQEWEIGSDFEGRPTTETAQYYEHDYIYTPHKEFVDGESFVQLVKRVGDFIYNIESKYKNKNILIVGHGGIILAFQFMIDGFSFSDLKKENPLKNLNNAEIKEIDFIPLPHNENYELDLHRPYVDEVNLVCPCGGNLVRTKEVMDVWLDSGAMPFAQDHYPFENKKWVDGVGYPADFISEAIDQTRGWFYTLHAIGILMGRGKAYKNVICLGHLLDAKGKKMSKSLGNIVDPWDMIEKYGADTLRLWMYSINQPGESKNFDEKTVLELHRQVFGLLYNVLAFYELYRDKNLERNDRPKSDNILDQWILAKLDELIGLTTKNLDKYKLLEPTRAIRDFIGDFSTWYLRRSRERIKEEVNSAFAESSDGARQTLYFVLKTLAKLMAPFAPLAAEDIWLKLRTENDKESVHLTSWPVKKFKIFSFSKTRVLESMETVRKIVTLGLEARQKAGIKVRQPLNRLEIVAGKLLNDYIEIIKDELNVKNIDYLLKIKIGIYKVTLDTKITPELKEEGNYRELARAIQDMRKKIGLTPSDIISLFVETNDKGKKLIQKFEAEIKKTILVSKIEFKENTGEPARNAFSIADAGGEIKIDNLIFKISIQK